MNGSTSTMTATAKRIAHSGSGRRPWRAPRAGGRHMRGEQRLTPHGSRDAQAEAKSSIRRRLDLRRRRSRRSHESVHSMNRLFQSSTGGARLPIRHQTHRRHRRQHRLLSLSTDPAPRPPPRLLQPGEQPSSSTRTATSTSSRSTPVFRGAPRDGTRFRGGPDPAAVLHLRKNWTSATKRRRTKIRARTNAESELTPMVLHLVSQPSSASAPGLLHDLIELGVEDTGFRKL